MEKEECGVTYAVDLSREEYVRSQQLVSRRMSGARWISPVLFIICVMMTVGSAVQSGMWDVSTFVVLALLLIAEVWMMLSLPKQVRRHHEAAYNATVFRGYEFEGTVTVERDAIKKQTRTATAVIPFSQCRLFVEAEDMMVFFGQDGKGIVIPSRFLTAETAEATRQAATAAIPVSNRLMLAPVIPTASTQPAFEPQGETNNEVRLTLDIDYTDREMTGIAVETSLQQFWETLPNKFLLMTMAAMAGYFMLGLPPLAVFLAGMLLLFLIGVFSAYIKIKRIIRQSERSVCAVRVEFTDREILLFRKADAEGAIHFPWDFLTRAVDCGDRVELYVDNVQQLLIPKRCVEDFEQLRDTIDSHMK